MGASVARNGLEGGIWSRVGGIEPLTRGLRNRRSATELTRRDPPGVHGRRIKAFDGFAMCCPWVAVYPQPVGRVKRNAWKDFGQRLLPALTREAVRSLPARNPSPASIPNLRGNGRSPLPFPRLFGMVAPAGIEPASRDYESLARPLRYGAGIFGAGIYQKASHIKDIARVQRVTIGRLRRLQTRHVALEFLGI